MATTTTTADALGRVIAAFEAVPFGEGKWKGVCPECKHKCLLIQRGDKQPVAAWCSRECDKKKVNVAVYKAAGLERGSFTVARYAEMKKLPKWFLTGVFGVSDAPYIKKDGKISKELSVMFVYTDADGQLTGMKHRFSESSHDTAWREGYKPSLYGLHVWSLYAEEGIATDVVTLVEGESDTQTLSYNGIPALGISGAKGWKKDYAALPMMAKAKHILVMQEPGEDGAKLVQKVAASFPAGKVNALKLPAKDPSAMWISSTPEEFAAAWDKAVAEAVPVCAPAPDDYIAERLSDITPKAMLWLWPGRIPQGKLTMWAGNPGVGKGLASCSVAATVSTGRCFPDEDFADREPADVCMLFCEDDAEDTVVPRLMAAGADLKRIFTVKAPAILEAGPDATHSERELALDSDLKILRKFLKDHANVKLVIVDPISSYMGSIKPNDESQVRSVLIPLRDLAQETNVSFVLVAHFNKRSDVNALHKILGAVAMTGVARAAWLFAEDADVDNNSESDVGIEGGSESKYLMLQGKMNVGRKMKGLEYTIGEKQILPKPADGTAYIIWGKATDKTADKALGSVGAFQDSEGSKRKQAAEWLKRQLEAGPQLAREVYAAAEGAGIAKKTLNRAKDDVGVQSDKLAGAWVWKLREFTGGPEDPM